MTKSLSKEKLLNLPDIINPAALVYLQRIAEYKGKQVLYPNQQSEYLDKLQIDSIIANTIASNAIDNIKISKHKFIQLFEEIEEPQNDTESEIIRYVKNIYLINSHYETMDISSETILQLHRNIFRYKPGHGGKWKPLDNIIERINDDGTTSISFVPVPAENTPEFIEDLCVSYNDLINDPEMIDLIVVAAFILDFLCIHPFTDGNGRISRLLTQLLLYKLNYQVVKYSALDEIFLNNKSKYFYSLNRASQGWHEEKHNMSLWLEYFLQALYQSYRKLDEKIFPIKGKKGAKSQHIKSVIDSLNETFKVGEIADKCPGIARPTVNKVLQELRDQKLITPLSLGRDSVWKKLY